MSAFIALISVVVLPVGLVEEVLRLFPIEFAEAEEQRGLFLLVLAELDDLLKVDDLLAPLRRDLQLDAEPELVVLQRRSVIALLLLARDVTGERLVGPDVRLFLLELDFFGGLFVDLLVVGLSERDGRDRNQRNED
ncbi:MAG: hypothetical protein QM817_10965 [Archangium sp.]